MIRHNSWLRQSARRARRHGRAPVAAGLLSAGPLSRLATWFCHLMRQADTIRVVAVKRS
jgi:hypothetical protein